MRAVRTGKIIIKPLLEENLPPSSIRIHLGRKAYKFRTRTMTRYKVASDHPTKILEPLRLEGDELVVLPGQFILAESLERISLPFPFLGFVSSLSSLARIGIETTRSSFLIQSGFGGEKPLPLALELHSVAPISVVLPMGFPVAQLMISVHRRLTSRETVASEYGQLESLFPDFSRHKLRKNS